MSLPAQARRYLWTLVGLSTGTLLLIATFNVLIDPLSVFGTGRRAGFNDRLPNPWGFDCMTKPYEILRVHPRTILVGSSTAQYGFRHLGEWKTSLPGPVFNYGLIAVNACQVRASLTQALRECPIETVVMVADFFAYNVHYAGSDRFDPARLSAASHRRLPGFLASDLAAFTLGCEAFDLSRETFSTS